ncbi:hypothetical protein [Corynebacterium sanguinis]|uniref:hypothetical protein n=1 Tax=Corynebacterium sanguinis TaxID=2594913 RepID=UPI00223BE72A|nr:hypothetical protein [Corynebacterium sanguinis]MCT1555402.1 hypothetical protein [Corynebacterium sanguinis]MCT1663859.1 hypothetical protein [Corynebacterium sanguinis]MDN8576352.1 hypothetical protein [Corynebacterium sanguinis]
MDIQRKRQLVKSLVDTRGTKNCDHELLRAMAAEELVRVSARFVCHRSTFGELERHEREWLRAWAVGKTVRKAALGGRSAARVHGMPVIATSPEDIELVPATGRCPSNSSWPRGCTYFRGAYRADEFTLVDGVRVTTQIRTGIDVALRHGFREGLVAMDWLLGRHPRANIEFEIRKLGRRRGIGVARAALAHAVSNVRSPYESYARALLIEAGIGPIRVNVRVGRYEVDLLIGERVVVEIDGAVKYDGKTYGRTDEMLRKEREREKHLLNSAYHVRRYSPLELLSHPDRFVAEVRLAREISQPPASPEHHQPQR